MTQEPDVLPNFDASVLAVLPKRVDARIEKQNRRLMTNLQAWTAILDALGWNVALKIPPHEPILSPRATEWTRRHSDAPMTWEDILAHLTLSPPAYRLVESPHIHVWADADSDCRPVPAQALFQPLTKREAEVLCWLREGKTGPEISIILGCAPRTVESHVARLYRKIGVTDRSQLLFQTAPHLW